MFHPRIQPKEQITARRVQCRCPIVDARLEGDGSLRMTVTHRPSPVEVSAPQSELTVERRTWRVCRIRPAGHRHRQELGNRVARDVPVNIETVARGVGNVPMVNRGLLHLMARNERDVLLQRRPRPDVITLFGRSQHVDQMTRSIEKPIDEVVARHIHRTPFVGRCSGRCWTIVAQNQWVSMRCWMTSSTFHPGQCSTGRPKTFGAAMATPSLCS